MDLADGLPFFTTGDRDYKTFSFLLILCLRVKLITLMITPFIKFLIITLQVRSTRLKVNSYCRAHLARLARDTRAVNRSERMVDYRGDSGLHCDFYLFL